MSTEQSQDGDTSVESSDGVELLLVGLDAVAYDFIIRECKSIEPKVQFTVCAETKEFERSFESWEDGMFAAVLGGTKLEGVPGTELAQIFLNQCPNSPRVFITSELDQYAPRTLIKNGFNQAYGLPQDSELVKRTLQEIIFQGRKSQKVFRAVKVEDIEEGGNLDFNTYVYLPLNNRYVTFSRPDKELTKEKVAKLKKRSMAQVYLEKKDLNKFYQYTAERMMALGKTDGVSATENQEKLNEMVRTLFTDIYDASVKADFDAGKEMIQQTEKIISNYITKGATSNWYKKLLATIGESSDSYSHAGNVSTLAALFAIGLGHPHPEDLAMAGLFHDLGLSTLPAELQEMRLEDMDKDQRELYVSHPERSVNSVKNKRIIVTPPVEKAIMQHHERWDGKGFPKGLSTLKLGQEGQILSFADQFDYLTKVVPGRPRLSPLEAWHEIKLNGSINPELMSQLKRLLEAKTTDSNT